MMTTGRAPWRSIIWTAVSSPCSPASRGSGAGGVAAARCRPRHRAGPAGPPPGERRDPRLRPRRGPGGPRLRGDGLRHPGESGRARARTSGSTWRACRRCWNCARRPARGDMLCRLVARSNADLQRVIDQGGRHRRHRPRVHGDRDGEPGAAAHHPPRGAGGGRGRLSPAGCGSRFEPGPVRVVGRAVPRHRRPGPHEPPRAHPRPAAAPRRSVRPARRDLRPRAAQRRPHDPPTAGAGPRRVFRPPGRPPPAP